MATKVDTFVELAEDELSAIRADAERLALKAQVLNNRWTALGKITMVGWAEYNWAGKPYTAPELAAALNGLAGTIETASAVNLTNLHTATVAIDRIVKASL
jgi:hypothetical protein